MMMTMNEFDAGLILAAWLTGLAGGSGHCLGMCGGIIGALGLGQDRSWRNLRRIVCAHLGRISSYSLAGALVGVLGAGLFAGLFGDAGIGILRGLAALLIGLIGLQLLFNWSLLAVVEKGGAHFWRLLAPQMRRLLPPRTAASAFAVGALWGWLPCGLVYAQLAVAAASGGAFAGAVVMLAFGLGTIVSLSALSLLLHSVGLGRMPRQLSGVLLLLFAVWTAMPLLRSAQHMQ